MSSDFIINTNDLKKAGVGFKHTVCDITGEPITLANFPCFKYWRECLQTIGAGGEITHISCGGKFREWLKEFLKINNINYEMY